MRNNPVTSIVFGMILAWFGLLIVVHAQVAITTPSGSVSNLDSLTNLDPWNGWVMIVFAIDSLLLGKPISLLVNHILTPILRPVMEALVGKERLERWQAKLNAPGVEKKK